MPPLFDDLLCCPKCHGRLVFSQSAVTCRLCRADYPRYGGVADFRQADPDFRPSAKEARIRDVLLAEFGQCTFMELLALHFSHLKGGSRALWQMYKRLELAYEAKGEDRAFLIATLLKASGRSVADRKVFLEIGCGYGLSVPWIMTGFDRGLGIDFDLCRLIVGKKFLDEQGFDRLSLVCADARHLPVESGRVDFANATDTIEHIIPGQERFLEEARRVLKKGGGFYFNSPNRFNLFTPEPHVKIRLVGFFPRPLMNRFVQAVKGVSYENIRLLSLTELRRYLRSVFGRQYHLEGPFFDMAAPATDFKRAVIKKYPLLLAFVNRFFFFFTTNYQVIAFK